jgi:hypothetical protein
MTRFDSCCRGAGSRSFPIHGYQAVGTALDPGLLAGTGVGARVIDVIIAETIDTQAATTRTTSRPDAAGATSGTAPQRRATSGTGVGLARLALDVFRSRAGAYPDGIRVPELLHELEAPATRSMVMARR